MPGAATGVRRTFTSKPRSLGVDAWVWVAIVAMTPIQQLLFVQVGSPVRVLPLLAALASLLLARVAMPRMQGALVLAATLITLAGLISGQNSNRMDSFVVGLSLALLVAITPAALLYQMRRYPTFLRSAIIWALIVQTISAAAGIVQLAGIPVLGVIARDGRVNGLAYHPNVLGVMAALGILILLDVLRRRAAPRFVVFVALVINAVALVSTASLSSLITLLVGLLFFGARLTRAARWVAAVVAAILLAFALFVTGGNLITLLPDAFNERVGQVTGAVDSDVASLQVRLQTYEFALQHIAVDPIVGVGMDPMNQGTLTPSLVVHNYILRGWFQGGILLLAGFTILTITLVAAAALGMRKTQLTAPSAIIVSVIAFGLTSAFYTQSHYWMPILFSITVISYLAPRGHTRRPIPGLFRRGARPATQRDR